MPMVWNAEADAKLFAGFIKIHNVKVDLKALAEYMGSECTPKAITHRLANIKKRVGDSGTTTSPATPSANRARATAATTPRTPKSTTSSAKAAGKKRKAGRESEDEEAESSGGDDEEVLGRIKSFDDVDSGDDAGQAVDRTPLRRSVSAKPGRYAGMDDDEEDEEVNARGHKRAKVEVEH